MSFDQRSFDDKTGVNADSFSAQPSLQHMSRRCIMSLSVKAARIVGLEAKGELLSIPIITSATLLASPSERPHSSA